MRTMMITDPVMLTLTLVFILSVSWSVKRVEFGDPWWTTVAGAMGDVGPHMSDELVELVLLWHKILYSSLSLYFQRLTSVVVINNPPIICRRFWLMKNIKCMRNHVCKEVVNTNPFPYISDSTWKSTADEVSKDCEEGCSREGESDQVPDPHPIFSLCFSDVVVILLIVSFPGVGSALSLLYSTYQLIFFLDFSIVKHFEVAKAYLFNV